CPARRPDGAPSVEGPPAWQAQTPPALPAGPARSRTSATPPRPKGIAGPTRSWPPRRRSSGSPPPRRRTFRSNARECRGRPPPRSAGSTTARENGCAAQVVLERTGLDQKPRQLPGQSLTAPAPLGLDLVDDRRHRKDDDAPSGEMKDLGVGGAIPLGQPADQRRDVGRVHLVKPLGRRPAILDAGGDASPR